MLKTVGPKPVLEAELRGRHGIERALIYGSWARRYHGEPGPFPQDVDLMIIGAADVNDVRAAVDASSRALGRDVNVSVLTSAEWAQARSGLVKSLKAASVVELDTALP